MSSLQSEQKSKKTQVRKPLGSIDNQVKPVFGAMTKNQFKKTFGPIDDKKIVQIKSVVDDGRGFVTETGVEVPTMMDNILTKLSQLEGRVNALESDNAILKSDNAILKSDNAILKRGVRSLALENHFLKSCNDSLVTRVEKLEEKFNKVGRRVVELKGLHRTAQNNLANMEEGEAMSDLSEIFAEQTHHLEGLEKEVFFSDAHTI